jgi:hypothetical protein
MNTLTPVEDINAIASRFQAWAGSQAPRNRKDGVRELTYEEAIGVHRSRATSETPAAKPENHEPPMQPQAPVPAVKPEKLRKQAVPPVKQRRKVHRTTHRDVSRPSFSIAEPEFQRVLAQSASLLPAATSSGTEIVHRPVSLSIRVSENEQALIKARALEANLSVSAYLRQCAFQVEQLRARTEWELAPAPSIPALPQSTSTFAPGFLTRIVHRLLGRSTTLAIQA